jgi:hypothetical protein
MCNPEQERHNQELKVPYERPTVVVVGNLKDLLAGTGTQLSDSSLCDTADATTQNCTP